MASCLNYRVAILMGDLDEDERSAKLYDATFSLGRDVPEEDHILRGIEVTIERGLFQLRGCENE